MDTNKALASVTTLSDVEGLCVTFAGKEGSSDPGVAVKVQNFTKKIFLYCLHLLCLILKKVDTGCTDAHDYATADMAMLQ
jgi:hypothetical protein